MLNKHYEHINSFTFSGINSLSMGIAVEKHENLYGAPAPIVETVYIPGRGNLIVNNKVDPVDNEEFEDYNVLYSCHIMPEYKVDIGKIAKNIHAWLFGNIKYDRLEDTYDRDYFRMAYCGSNLSVEEIAKGLLGKLNITFNSKGLKLAKDGEKTIMITKTTAIHNTELFTAAPYMKIYGNGSITIYINDRAHTFTDVSQYIEVDSALSNAFKGEELQNNKMISTRFPKLTSGRNAISWAGSVSKIELIPRWCSL
jgi:Phage-related protein